VGVLNGSSRVRRSSVAVPGRRALLLTLGRQESAELIVDDLMVCEALHKRVLQLGRGSQSRTICQMILGLEFGF